MDFFIFKSLAFLYTTLIVCGTVLVPGYIVNSKLVLLQELLFANPDSALINIKGVQNYNQLPEKDLQLTDKEVLWKSN